MKQITLCTATMLLIISLTGCGATPQDINGQNELTKEETSVSADVVKISGSSLNGQSSSYTRKEKMYAPYEEFGMNYDAEKDELTYNGKLVRWFEDFYSINDKEMAGLSFLNENGTVDVYAVRNLENTSKLADGSADTNSTLIGLKEFSQQEFEAREIATYKSTQSVTTEGKLRSTEETARLVGEYKAFGLTYDADNDQIFFNGEKVRYFQDVLTSNGENLTSGKFKGEMRTLGNGTGTVDIYSIRDYSRPDHEKHGTLTGIEKFSQKEFDEHTKIGLLGAQAVGSGSYN